MAGESDSDDMFQKRIELQNQTNKINVKPLQSSNALPKYTVPQHQQAVSYSFDAANIANAQGQEEPSLKMYCLVGYRIIVHLLLLYCVFGVS